MSHLLIWGNAYAQIIRDGGGRVLGLYPLLPDKVEVDRDGKGELYYVYNRYSDENPNFGEYGRAVCGEEPAGAGPPGREDAPAGLSWTGAVRHGNMKA